MATGAVPVRIRTATHFSLENSHRETSHRGRTFRSPWAFVGFTATLRYEPCPQFINVSQKALHIYWQFSAMSHAIHKIVSKKRCQSYFISRRSPHLGISKDSESCASAHRCLHYAYARLIARVTFNLQHLGSVHGQLKRCLQHFRCALTHHHTSKEYLKILIHAADLRINLQIQ